MIRVDCDSCEKTLAEDEAQYTLEIKGVKHDSTIHPLRMDLCPRCARRYLKVLKEPV